MRLKSHIITTLIATLIQTMNQEVSVTEINSFTNESLVVFPTPKVVANISPIRQKRLKDMLTVTNNFMKQLVFRVFPSMHDTYGWLLAEM